MSRGATRPWKWTTLQAVLTHFSVFPQIQVIALDAALGAGDNNALVAHLATHALIRAGGGVRSAARARQLIEQGAHRVIIGTAAFERPLLEAIIAAVGKDRLIIALDSRGGRVVIRGWREATEVAAEDVIQQLEPCCSGFLCTYVDKEGLLQGTDLAWFRRLRAATSHELTAAGGITTTAEIRALHALGIHAALGMALYTGSLSLDALAGMREDGGGIE